MSWNHRVVRKTHPETGEYSYQIHEVFYDDDGNAEYWTAEAVVPFGETLEQLQKELACFQDALKATVLAEATVDGVLTLVEDHAGSGSPR
jgi:hypothetical protein